MNILESTLTYTYRPSHLIVWAFGAFMTVFIFMFFSRRMKKINNAKKAAQAQYLDRQDKYTYLKEGTLDEIPEEEYDAAVLFHCQRIEDENEDCYEVMNHSERLVFGIYLLNQSISGKHDNILGFFQSPATRRFGEDIENYFEEIGAHEIYDLLVACKRLIEIIDNDLEDDDDDPLMGDYSRYNFTDFTQEYITLVSTTAVGGKISKYIAEHKEDFYDHDIPVNSEEE